jgi:dipeptidyl aminopeptidase/acylaminoacyl peptidase
MRATVLCTLALLVGLSTLHAQESSKVPLDHSAYDEWRTIEGEALSRDGHWLLYGLAPQDGDAELRVHGLELDSLYAVPRGSEAAFTADGAFAVFLIGPELALVRQARREEKKKDDLPQDSLGILDLATGEVVRVERVKSFQLPEDVGGWLAYLLERPVEEDSAAEEETVPGEQPDTAHVEQEPDTALVPQEPDTAQAEEKDDDEVGTPLVLRHLTTGEERRFEHVMEYVFAKDGRRLAYAVSSPDGSGDGVWVVELASGESVPLLTGRGTYESLAFDEEGRQVAFLTNRDDVDAEQPSYALYHWRVGMEGARRAAHEGAEGVPQGWWVSEHGEPSFSENGRRLFFGTAPRPAPEPEDSLLDEEKVTVDIWHWQDPYLQPMQLDRLDEERKRHYTAVVHLRHGTVVQLATLTVPEVAVGAEGDADVALGSSVLPYRQLRSWDFPWYRDVYLVDVRTGERELLLEKTQARPSLSPDAKYVAWYDNREEAWFAQSTRGGGSVKLTQGIPHPLYDEEDDTPSPPSPYGSAGWTEDDREFLVYDRHDIWATDPTGRSAPRNLTEGMGRAENLRFRYVRLDPEEEAIADEQPLLLGAIHYHTKAAGFFRARVEGDAQPQRLLFMDRRFTTPRKARDADRFFFHRSSVDEFPDVWVSDLDFAEPRRVSDANPQQADYLWATVELVEWRSTDGVPLQGLLYAPEDFDPSRQYPLIVYFYERNSHNLHTHYPPLPHRSVIRPTFYASRGYVVFIPDIVYREGYPGQSALDCVVPGVLEVARRGFIDEENIGMQGHSWGGYQIAYMVTRTNLFKAAAGGAPVSNMTSAYGGIRWGSGMSRMFQYERTQSRIGASLWEAPLRYLENSPVFWADKIETPLLMMHNDQDGAVPWYQGIELFVALRRLGKPAWLVNYNGEPHWPTTYANKRDWNIRLQQFFDHYLKGAPAPEWLVRGVPALEKGRTLGLELVGQEAAVPQEGGSPR